MAPRSRASWSDDEAREYATILELASDAVLVLDLEGKIRFWNRGAERLYGWTSGEVLGKSAHELLRSELPVPRAEILAAVRVQGEWRGEIIHINKEGLGVVVATRWTPRVDANGKLIGTFEINRDLTEEKRRQENIRNAERLATLGRLAATVAHEINNPLDVLNNIFYLLKQQPLSGAASALVQQAELEVKCIADITNATLRYSRSSGQPAQTSLSDILDNVLAMHSGQIRTRNVQVERRYRTEGNVIARAGELRQVFANLVGNALDALPAGGRLRVSLTGGGSNGFFVAIADHGTGISPAVREKIFEPFFTTKGASGTGLGLWIARGIVRNHGGTIRVRSYTQPGRSGTVFMLWIRKSLHGQECSESVA
ncbi:MAG: PAS domain S-box protein [Acidobacteriia bacterium]|nr:PAS domain S-box protein [Terriglobia bacterium]